MTTKEKMLELFETNKGIYFSGEEIAKRLVLSRASIWKAVKALQGEGYVIDAITNKGYCLSEDTDILSLQGIRKYLQPECAAMDIVVLTETNSTNALMREKAITGVTEGYSVIAGTQTAGRGRLGRNFFSPSDTGIYLSLLLRPNCDLSQRTSRITTIAAIAMCEAIESVSEETAQIKWVNDIFIRGKKVCGILTEASVGLESGLLEYAILGVGVNVYRPKNGFPVEFEQTAGAIFSSPCGDAKNRLTAEFLNRFIGYYSTLDKIDYAEKYRERSLAIGCRVSVIRENQSKSATVIDIDDDCRLLVKYDDGSEACLSSGEISIKL